MLTYRLNVPQEEFHDKWLWERGKGGRGDVEEETGFPQVFFFVHHRDINRHFLLIFTIQFWTLTLESLIGY